MPDVGLAGDRPCRPKDHQLLENSNNKQSNFWKSSIITVGRPTRPRTVCLQTDHEISQPLGPDWTIVHHGLSASSGRTWSAIRNTERNSSSSAVQTIKSYRRLMAPGFL